MGGFFMPNSERQGSRVREVVVDLDAGLDARPDYGSGPYLALVGAVVRLARRDLTDPEHSEEAKAFLLGQPFDGSLVGVDVDLFAECLGYGGSFL